MLPLRLFRSRAFSATNASRSLMSFGMFGSIFLLAQFLQTVQGYSAFEAGPAHPAVDADADVRRPVAGMPLRPDRRPAADGARARAAVDRARPGCARSLRSTSPTRGWSPPFVLAGTGMALGLRPRRQRAARRRAPRGGRAGARARTTRSARSAACRRRRARLGVRRRPAATTAGRRSSTGSCRRVWSARACSRSARCSRCSCPARRGGAREVRASYAAATRSPRGASSSSGGMLRRRSTPSTISYEPMLSSGGE